MATAPERSAAPDHAPDALQHWVMQVAARTKPDRVHWCDGSEAEYRELIRRMQASGDLMKLREETFPGCHLHRSNPSDVARVEHLTFVCTERQEDAGPNNHWMAPADARRRMDALFEGCMRGRTMYVIPYCMGPIDSPYSRCGVEITDSAYVAANMRLMTRMGAAALARIARDGVFVRGLHSIGELDPDRRFIMHFPESLEIQSYGSGYGGNALLGKKCHALRIASWQARDEGWLAEHMLIVGVENPAGETHYLACAFPSACGKTNLAMLIPPATMPGWKIWTVGDDIAWLHPGPDGRLWAINPEAGYFGVVPGTNAQTNRHAFEMIRHDTIFTNVALTADNEPWWEGLDQGVPAFDWQGRPFDPARGPAAHPNSRFTVSARQNPSYSPMADAPAGVPISALVFGGRRTDAGPARVPGSRLGAWRAGRRRHGIGDDCRGRRRCRRRSPRPDGDETLRRLQLRRLLGPLAVDGEARPPVARRFPRQLVPSRCRRPFPLAGLRREPARARLDHRTLQGQRGRARHADRGRAPPRRARLQRPRARRRHDRRAACGRSCRVARGSRGNRPLPGKLRCPPAGGPAR